VAIVSFVVFNYGASAKFRSRIDVIVSTYLIFEANNLFFLFLTMLLGKGT